MRGKAQRVARPGPVIPEFCGRVWACKIQGLLDQSFKRRREVNDGVNARIHVAILLSVLERQSNNEGGVC